MSQKHKTGSAWWPGKYEGLTAEQARAQVGTARYESKFKGQSCTPDDFLWQRIAHNLTRHTSAKY